MRRLAKAAEATRFDRHGGESIADIAEKRARRRGPGGMGRAADARDQNEKRNVAPYESGSPRTAP